MSTRHEILPNLIIALSAWAIAYGEDANMLETEKTILLSLLESLEEMKDSMKRLRQLLRQLNNQTNTTDDHHLNKFMITEAIDGGEEHEARVYEFIENCCGEMVAWTLADPTTEDEIDSEDVDHDEQPYEGILDNPIDAEELILSIKNGNQERKEIIDRFS